MLNSIQGLFFNMGILRIYRKFYCVSTFENVYTPISPLSLNASSYVAGTGGTESSIVIESNIPIIQEENGIYYADLNPQLYSSDITYDLVWYVQYISISPPDKKLITRFRIMPFNIANQIDYEINNTPIEYEIIGTYN